MSPERIGPYEDLKEIGRGGMGVVYSARDPKLGRTVVLKKVLAENEAARQLLMREAKVLAALDHPYICRIYDALLHEGEVYLVLEYVRGSSFSEALAQPDRSLSSIIELVSKITEALESAHNQGIIHRDLKPSNIFLTPEGYPKLLDFGLARLPDGDADATRSVATSGTLLYMSPEQVRGETLDARSDVFSVGVLLWECLTGTHPFAGGSTYEIIRRIVEDPPRGQWPDRHPPRLRQAILTMLEKKPADRPATMAEVRRLLKSAIDAVGSGSGIGFQPKASRRALVAAALLFVALLVGGVIWYRPNAFQRRPGSVSVAVLPFTNVGNDPETDYFGEGLTEEIITELSRVKALRVLPRATVNRYRNTDRDARQIGSQLQVSHILEGSVRRTSDNFRINVRLISVEDGASIWSDSYPGSLQTIFEVQDRVAESVLEHVNLEISPTERDAIRRRMTNSVEAYDDFLRARTLQERNLDDEDALRQALRLYERAARLDPGFAAAQAGMSTCYGMLYRNGFAAALELERSEDLALLAMKLAPESEFGFTALALVRGNQGRWPQSAKMATRSLAFNPRDPAVWKMLSWASSYQVPPDIVTAEKAARRALELEEKDSTGQYLLGLALLRKGDLPGAETSFRKALQINPASGAPHTGLAHLYLASNKPEEALAAIEQQLSVTPGSGQGFFDKACILTVLGRTQPALDSLSQAIDKGFTDRKEILSESKLKPLHSTPRFRALMRRTR